MKNDLTKTKISSSLLSNLKIVRTWKKKNNIIKKKCTKKTIKVANFVILGINCLTQSNRFFQ